MKALFLRSTLFGLMACTSGETTDEPSETAETGASFVFTHSEVQVVHISATLPFLTLNEASKLVQSSATGCPHVSPTADDRGLIVTGNCTDEKGTIYTGEFLYTSAEIGNAMIFDFSNFSIEDQSLTLSMNGLMTLDLDTELLESGLSIEMSDSSHNIQLTATYSDHTLGPVLSISEFFGGRAGSFSSTGTVELLDLDRFSLTGTFENTDLCPQEGDDVVLIFEGERGTLTFIENAESCDGCSDWTDGVGSGQICLP
jgi:hypothetical protein